MLRSLAGLLMALAVQASTACPPTIVASQALVAPQVYAFPLVATPLAVEAHACVNTSVLTARNVVSLRVERPRLFPSLFVQRSVLRTRVR